MVSTLRNIPWYFLSAVTVVKRLKAFIVYIMTSHCTRRSLGLIWWPYSKNTQQSVVMIKNMKQIIEKNIHSPTTALESCICIIFSVPFVFNKCTQKLLTSVLFHNYDFNLYEKFDPSNLYVFAPKNKWNSVHVLLKCWFSNWGFFPFAIFH